MARARITLGSTWVGTDTETVDIEVEDKEEFDSDEFSTKILDAITNHVFPHYFIDYEYIDEEKEDG